MGTEDLFEGLRQVLQQMKAIREDVDWPPALEIDHDGAITVPIAIGPIVDPHRVRRGRGGRGTKEAAHGYQEPDDRRRPGQIGKGPLVATMDAGHELTTVGTGDLGGPSWRQLQ